jgi:hypothetical protein
MVFLGPGLSFGGARQPGSLRRGSGARPDSGATFDYQNYQARWLYELPPGGLLPDDDGLPPPSWPMLAGRMCQEIALHSDPNEHAALRRFFVEESALDCAQPFARQSARRATGSS